MNVPSIPLYKQTADFSCGAASLVMALHALRQRPLTRSEEFEHWRVATMIGIPGIDQWGLALAARRFDVAATVIAPVDLTFPHRDLKHPFFSHDLVELTTFAQGENRTRARAAGVAWEQRKPTLEDVATALAHGKVPVLLVDLFTLSRGADGAPHWVVATHMDDRTVTLHDPAPQGPGVHRLPLAEAWECLDVSRYQAQHTVVVLGP
jgi:hypothetical protein